MKKLIAIIFCSLALIACHRINQSNFDKIKTNMTLKEVTAILGEPTNSDSVNIAGVSGTAAVWKDGNAEINIQFLNGVVFLKTYSKGSQD